MDFADAIERALSSCKVVLTLIGRWLTITDVRGQRCLDNPKDWVRLETSKALSDAGADQSSLASRRTLQNAPVPRGVPSQNRISKSMHHNFTKSLTFDAQLGYYPSQIGSGSGLLPQSPPSPSGAAARLCSGGPQR